jgi:AraC-like DNA-binding protein
MQFGMHSGSGGCIVPRGGGEAMQQVWWGGVSELEMIAAGLYAASAGVAALACLNLLTRSPAVPAYAFGGAFFLVFAVQSVLNVLLVRAEVWPIWVMDLSGVLLASIIPLLWLYIDDLTADRVRGWLPRDLLDFASAGAIAVSTVVTQILMPGVSGDGPAAAPPAGLLWLRAAVMLLFMVQMSVILARSLLRLFRLRARLRLVFSNTEERELTWLRVLALLLAANWLLNILDNLDLLTPPDIAFAGGTLAFALAMAHWSLRQRPAFQFTDPVIDRQISPDSADEIGRADPVSIESAESDHGAPGSTAAEARSAGGVKYGRSLLPEERLKRIQAKVELAFTRDQRHLDPTLSLRKLSEATGVSESHLSQTFSRCLGCTFFDYVNRWRVEAAKLQLRDSEDGVITIAHDTGFNSRSAFYNAFRQETGTTPAAYRAGLRSGGAGGSDQAASASAPAPAAGSASAPDTSAGQKP